MYLYTHKQYSYIHINAHTHTHTHIYIYIYIYISLVIHRQTSFIASQLFSAARQTVCFKLGLKKINKIQI